MVVGWVAKAAVLEVAGVWVTVSWVVSVAMAAGAATAVDGVTVGAAWAVEKVEEPAQGVAVATVERVSCMAVKVMVADLEVTATVAMMVQMEAAADADVAEMRERAPVVARVPVEVWVNPHRVAALVVVAKAEAA